MDARAQQAAQHREQRDRIIGELAGEEWTYAAIAGAVGCSAELVAKVLTRRGEQRRKRGDPG